MILGPKDYIIIGLGIALGAAALGGSWMFGQMQDANKAAAVATERAQNLEGAVNVCNASVEGYQKAAEERAKLMEPVIEEAKVVERTQNTKAQTILSAAPSSDNDCQSATNLATEWLKGKRK